MPEISLKALSFLEVWSNYKRPELQGETIGSPFQYRCLETVLAKAITVREWFCVYLAATGHYYAVEYDRSRAAKNSMYAVQALDMLRIMEGSPEDWQVLSENMQFMDEPLKELVQQKLGSGPPIRKAS